MLSAQNTGLPNIEEAKRLRDDLKTAIESMSGPASILAHPIRSVMEDKPDGLGVYRCIAKVSAEIAQAGISKTQTNAQQGYKFRGIDDVYNALAPILAKHGLVILPRILNRQMTEWQTKNGGAIFTVVVEAEFDFVSAFDGSKHTVKMFGEAMDTADKATNKAMSAAYKYAAFQTFCIPTEGEHDADAQTLEVTAPAPRPDPPSGYRYIDKYLFRNGWHNVTIGELTYSTKTDVGFVAEQAFNNGVPVQVEWKSKPNSKGEAWLEKVHPYKPEMPTPVAESDVVF